MAKTLIDNAVYQNKWENDDVKEEMRQSLHDIFKRLCIPIPKEEEFRTGIGHYGQAFVHKAGAVIRIVNDKVTPLYRHRNLMRPIGSVKFAGNFRLDLQYGGITPVSKEAFEAISEQNFRDAIIDGLHIRDARRQNACGLKTKYSPVTTPIFFDPAGLDALIDTVRNISDNLKETKSGLGVLDLSPMPNEEHDLQDLGFSDLRKSFIQVFDSEEPDLEAAKNFWQDMIEATAQGRLHASWMNWGIFLPFPIGAVEHKRQSRRVSSKYGKSLETAEAFTAE